MSERFYCPDLEESATELVLTGSEAHHLRTVCRGRLGDRVELFDGRGLLAEAELISSDKKCSNLHVLAIHQAREETSGTTIACPIPKASRASWLVEKCTELGVSRLIPLRTQRSVVGSGEVKLDRLRRTVVEACKQSGRLFLMEIGQSSTWEECVWRTQDPGWLLDPSGRKFAEEMDQKPEIVAIGPEGGWTEQELSLATGHGWQIVSLPGHVLRVETAAITLASWARLQESRQQESMQ